MEFGPRLSMPREDRFPGNATAAYVAPFAAFVALMAAERTFALPAEWLYLVRFTVVLAVLAFVSRRVIPLRPSAPLASAAIGIAVFLIWIAPDVLFGAGYRHHWLFDNAVMEIGRAHV